jgi:hypothetical protein
MNRTVPGILDLRPPSDEAYGRQACFGFPASGGTGWIADLRITIFDLRKFIYDFGIF